MPALKNQYYISSGAKNAQFTLRVRFEEWAQHGGESGMVTRDQYVANLGVDIERAKVKAAQIAGEPVDSDAFALNPYGEADRKAAEERAERQEQERKRQAVIDAERAEKIRQRREADAKSEWQGIVGERITRELTCHRWIPTGEGMYGMRYVAIFTDAAMNKYVFFGAGAKSLPWDGETNIVTFTVSSHGLRDDAKQTVISRPKAMKAKVAA